MKECLEETDDDNLSRCKEDSKNIINHPPATGGTIQLIKSANNSSANRRFSLEKVILQIYFEINCKKHENFELMSLRQFVFFVLSIFSRGQTGGYYWGEWLGKGDNWSGTEDAGDYAEC